jgi:hypothetical protein
MANNFVLAFGGTGARCMEAIGYLCAARVIRDPAHMLLIDPDQANGNVQVAREQLQRYWRIHRSLESPGAGAGDAYFSTPINPAGDISSFFWQYPNPNQEFSVLLNHGAQAEPHQQLLELLYDEDDFNLTFEKGYIGRAHIGSLDLLRTLETGFKGGSQQANADPLRSFLDLLREAAQRPEGANLLVYGSIFGGTGASGLPAIPPLLKELFPTGLLEKIRIGCVQVAPYFTFPPGDSHDPDSALHPLATQAALYHYGYTDVGYERIYLVGAPDRLTTSNSNSPGGALQRNQAHYAELGAALAALHFFAQRTKKRDTVEVMACGSRELDWRGLPQIEGAQLKDKMVSFTTFCLLHAHFLFEDLQSKRHVGSRWTHDLKRGVSGGRQLHGEEAELEDMNRFARRYLDWIKEIEDTPEVDLFTVHANPTAASLGQLLPRSPDNDAYDAILRNLNGGKRIKQGTAPGWYLTALTESVDAFCRTHYQTT